MQTENFLDRKDRLKGEGKVELPLNVDTKKYLIGNISFFDLLVVSPFIVISLVLLAILHQYDSLSVNTIMPSIALPMLVTVLQLVKHPIRKRNISFIQYGVIWRIKYKKRNKEFFYKKGAIDMSNREDKDTRKELSIKNIFSGCYETVDNRFVKVLEVSSVNLSLMNKTEKFRIFEAYKTFLSEMQYLKHIQISQISQPINLSKYLLHIDEITQDEKNPIKKLVSSSYKRQIENIQKSKKMVSRKRYIVIDQPISSDREKSLAELERKTLLTESNISNMLRGYSKLYVKTLKNDDLLKLMYSCTDYDNAQALGDFIITRANNKSNISVGEETARELIASLQKQLDENIT